MSVHMLIEDPSVYVYIYIYDREIGHIQMFITSVSICLHFSG